MQNIPRPTLSTFPPASSSFRRYESTSETSVEPTSTDSSQMTVTDVSTSFIASSTEDESQEESNTDQNQDSSSSSETDMSDYGNHLAHSILEESYQLISDEFDCEITDSLSNRLRKQELLAKEVLVEKRKRFKRRITM